MITPPGLPSCELTYKNWEEEYLKRNKEAGVYPENLALGKEDREILRYIYSQLKWVKKIDKIYKRRKS